MKKGILFTGVILLVSFFAVAEVKYIEVNEMSNISEIEFSNLEDFEPHAKGDVFYCPKTSKVYVLEGGTYYSYNLKGFKTITDVKSGIDYMEARDYYDAIELKISDAEKYYFYKVTSFNSVADCLDAYEKGYYSEHNSKEYRAYYANYKKYWDAKNDRNKSKELYENYRMYSGGKYNGNFSYVYEGETIDFEDSVSGTYYKAKDLGFSTPEKYAEYLFLKKHGFESLELYQTAKAKGFKEYTEYETATEKGFSSKAIFDSAKWNGLANQDEYNKYEAFSSEIKELVTEKSFKKSEAVVYHYLKKVPKGDISVSKVIENLKLQIEIENKNVKKAIEKFVGEDVSSDVKNTKNNSYYNNKPYSMESYVSESSLLTVINNSKELGRYNEKTGIFTKR